MRKKKGPVQRPNASERRTERIEPERRVQVQGSARARTEREVQVLCSEQSSLNSNRTEPSQHYDGCRELTETSFF